VSIETFLRPARGTAEFTADAIRVVGALSIVAGGLGWGFVEVAVFALTLLGMLIPRFLGVRPGFDIAIGASLLLAAWCGVFELYTAIDGLDIVVHFAANGLIAALAFVVAVRFAVVPAVGAGRTALLRSALLTTTFGLAAGVLWEIGEWAGHTFIDSAIFVNYTDTIGDLSVGGLGALMAGLMIRWLTATPRSTASIASGTPARSLASE
jgi:hypothetical protein